MEVLSFRFLRLRPRSTRLLQKLSRAAAPSLPALANPRKPFRGMRQDPPAAYVVPAQLARHSAVPPTSLLHHKMPNRFPPKCAHVPPQREPAPLRPGTILSMRARLPALQPLRDTPR